MAKTTPVRFRIAVPDTDVSCLEWIRNQNNLSSSIRQLIYESIQRNGNGDVTIREVHQLAKRGPRPKVYIEDTVNADDYEEMDDAIVESRPSTTVKQVTPVVEAKPEPVEVIPKSVPVVKTPVVPVQESTSPSAASRASSLLDSI